MGGWQEFISGNEQKEEGGSKSRKAVLWSWLEPGLMTYTDQNVNLVVTFYNRVTALGNLSSLSSLNQKSNCAFLGKLSRGLRNSRIESTP